MMGALLFVVFVAPVCFAALWVLAMLFRVAAIPANPQTGQVATGHTIYRADGTYFDVATWSVKQATPRDLLYGPARSR